MTTTADTTTATTTAGTTKTAPFPFPHRCPGRRGRRPARARSCAPRTRSLVLVDAENLAGTPLPDATTARRDAALVRTLAPVEPGDQVVVACSHLAAPNVWWAWPEALRRVRSGQDGADLALLDAIASIPVVDRFSRLVIASGDGIFSGLAVAMSLAGVHVVVVSRARSLSHQLAACADEIVTLT